MTARAKSRQRNQLRQCAGTVARIHIGVAACFVVLASGRSVVASDDSKSFAVRPGVRFLSPSRAELTWEATLAGPTSVAYGPTRKLGTIVKSSQSGTLHRVLLDGLEPRKSFFYRIAAVADGKRSISPFYEVDGRMNYAPQEVVEPEQMPAGLDFVIDQLRQPGGYAVISPSLADDWAVSLAARTTMTVVATGDSGAEVQRLRQAWYDADIYGIRLSAQLPEEVPAGFANLVVSDAASAARMLSLASPAATIVCIGEPTDRSAVQWTSNQNGIWVGHTVNLQELASWGHQYGTTGNASFSGETLAGVDETSELEVRWLGRPGADFGIDRNPRMPAPLATGGRLFHQGMNRMIALDAFNGAILWSLEIPDLRRVNIPRDCANWCADPQHVYAATRDCLWVIDAATGEMLHTMRLPKPFDQKFDWGYVAVTEDSIVGSAVKFGSAYEDYWEKAAWYDGKADATTSKVCASAIVSYDKKYGDVRWQRESDAVVQSTITIAGDRIFFVETEDPTLRTLDTSKLTNKQIWKNASVVCIDLNTGNERWRKNVPRQADDQIVAFGIADENQFILETSGDGQFHFVALDAESGGSNWSRSVPWPSGDHGDHMQHAVLMNSRLYVQPHVIDATDGHVINSDTLGKRRGCATPIGAGNSIIYRGGTGPLSLWSLERDRPTEFTRLRPSCWLSTIPAQGMLFSPEAGGGCSCGGWMECSIGFAPAATSAEAGE